MILRKIIKKYILVGFIRDYWIKKKSNKIENKYLSEIVDVKKHDVSNTSLKYKNNKIHLRNILYIADCMWEKDQLIPEMNKICDVDVLDLHKIPSESRISKQCVSEFVAKHNNHLSNPDVVILYARPSLLSEELFSIVRDRFSCPIIGMNLDDRVEFFPYNILKSGNDNYAQWINKFDVNLTSSITALDWYKAYGANAIFMPQGFRPDPRFLDPPKNTNFSHQFSFVGSYKTERGDLIEKIKDYGICPEIFGNGWKNGQWIEDPSIIFRNSQINLGIGYALATARIANAKGRDIECPATGACYLTTYHWEMAEMFVIGKEVLCYRNAEELIELYSYYSKRPEACLRIAQAAHARAHAEHKWETRLRNMFSELGFRMK